MKAEEQLEALKDIRHMMNRSVRFLTLSGLSGMLAGIYALIAFYFALERVNGQLPYTSYGVSDTNYFAVLALFTLILSLLTSFVLTKRKAKRQGVKLWDETAKTAVLNLFIPVATGGVVCLALLRMEMGGLLAPMTLIFYGLALVNVSKHTFPQIRQLGILEILLGLVNLFFIGYGLVFWAVGFGLLHVGYGLAMYFKYDRK